MVSISIESLYHQLRQQGLKLNPQRACLLQIFHALPPGQHIGAIALHQRLQQQGYPGSLATVYRNLHLLTRIGMVRELALASRSKLYELKHPQANSAHEHHHIICMQCEQIVEFLDRDVSRIGRKQTQQAGFELHSCQLMLQAICLPALEQGWPMPLPDDWTCPILVKANRAT